MHQVMSQTPWLIIDLIGIVRILYLIKKRRKMRIVWNQTVTQGRVLIGEPYFLIFHFFFFTLFTIATVFVFT